MIIRTAPHGVVLGSDCLGSPLNPNMDKHTSIPLPSPRQPDLSQHAASLPLRALRKSPHASHQLYWKAHPAFVCVYRLGRHLCTHSPIALAPAHPHPAAPPEYRKAFSDVPQHASPEHPSFVDFWDAPPRFWQPRHRQLQESEMDVIQVRETSVAVLKHI